MINKIKVRPVELPPYKILCTPVRHASGRVVGFLAMFREEKALNFEPRTERLVELLSRKTTTTLQNNYDALTSLLTRSAFETQVRAQLAARREPVPDCVLYLDVDRVHVVNDNFGMHVGDEVIGKVAEVLRKKPRPGALAARIAGDRFAVFLPDCTLEFAQQIGDMLRRQRSELTYARGDGTVQVSVSVGVAELPEESQHRLAHGLANAEIACKAAKDRGRNRVEIFQDADQSIIRRQHRRDGRAGAARGARGRPLRALCAADPAAQARPHRAALRVPAAHGQREQRAPAAGKIPVGRGALPAAAGHRPLGDQERARRARRARDHARAAAACASR